MDPSTNSRTNPQFVLSHLKRLLCQLVNNRQKYRVNQLYILLSQKIQIPYVFPNSSHSCHYRHYHTYRETWTLSKKMEQQLMTWERKILRKIYGPKYENGHWRIRYNTELKTQYKSPDIVAEIKALLTCYGTKIVLQWLKEGKLVINKISQLGPMDPSTNSRYCNEIETLGYVLGSCQHGELLRNSRHHNIRKLIAQALRKRSFEVHEEVHCIASEGGGIRRADIMALDKTNSKGFILDPTVRFEMSQTQPSEVNKEKQQIYEPIIPYFREKYQL
ncbi:hypothetical protein ANN_21785 [Periplaneta americana]|uniref:Uncharacterized protein n=1 Tax=Periplaneta americana TaxID=6978 RepID=A0ABQ8S6D2_PERAM|nr:hypothetical protein ANN_21785 [Periplaneta americana]